MKIFPPPLVLAVLSLGFFAGTVKAQPFFAAVTAAYSQAFASNDLFESDEILNIKLAGNIRELVNDRTETPKYHPFVLSYRAADSTETSVTIEAKTRGHFRRTMGDCTYPPILLHFLKNDLLQSSLFRDQTELKLVVPCQGEEYVVREWLVYKIYNLITPKSFRARLVRVELSDPKKTKAGQAFYGILIEEEKHMAARNQTLLVKRKILPQQADPGSYLTMTAFEYFIGNTDWSIQYLQNIKLLAVDSLSIPYAVPYDFDQSGVVNAPYAKPAEELEMSSVRERRYRGYCVPDMKTFDSVIVLFNQLKPAIYNLYTNCHLLDAKYIKATTSYFDEFYKTINNPAALQKEFSYPCDKSKTGNVIIRGLKDQ